MLGSGGKFQDRRTVSLTVFALRALGVNTDAKNRELFWRRWSGGCCYVEKSNWRYSDFLYYVCAVAVDGVFE